MSSSNDAFSDGKKDEKKICTPFYLCESVRMTTTTADKAKQLRSLLRRNVCSTLRVVMSRGTGYGNLKIKGSGEFGMFSENEKSALSKHNFNYGANCGIIMYEEVDAVIARLEKTQNGFAKGAVNTRKEPDLTSCDPCHALDNHAKLNTQPRTINIAAITSDARTVSKQIWTNDIADAHAVLDKWITPEEERWHGRIALAMISDSSVTGITTRYRRHGDRLYVIEA